MNMKIDFNQKFKNSSFNKINGFTLIELLVVIAVIGIIAAFIMSSLNEARDKGKNAAIVQAMSSVHSVIDASKYPGSLAAICFDFETGGEFANIRAGVEENGGIWHCDSTENEYRIFVKLNQKAVLSKSQIVESAYAQEEDSYNHNFGNYFCLNSDFDSNFTHWSGENLLYPSCDDSEYTPVIQDPVVNPDPTPDPEPETDPEPPQENGGAACDGGKVQVCHFSKTLCVSDQALKAHTKHGDVAGAC